MTSWTDDSAAWIAEQVKNHPEMDKTQLEKHCRKNYPWSMRQGWAYKAWLKAMRAYFNPQSVKPIRRGKQEPSAMELEKHGQARLIA